MKPIPTNALRNQLARGQSAEAAGPHPDAGLLTAFAEDALLDRERAGVLTHLAACPACRQLLDTATAAAAPQEAEILPQPARKPLRLWIPGLTLAASLLVMAASTILFYRATRTNLPHPLTAASAAPAQSAPASPAPQPALASAASPAPLPPTKVAHARRAARPQPPVASPALASSEAEVAPPAPAPPATDKGDAISGASLGALSEQNAQVRANLQQLQAQLHSETASYRAGNAAKASPRAPAPAAQAEARTSFVESSPRPMGMVAGLMTNPAAHPRFRITDSGQLERSTQSGVWEPVPTAPDVHFRVISISGTDVWAGGDHLRLFHSANSGLTWIEVELPASADRAQAIAHLRLDSPQHLTVESDTGATWTTTDAGATWQ